MIRSASDASAALGGAIDGAAAIRVGQDGLAIDAGQARGRPAFPHGQRDRPANQPKADDRNGLKGRLAKSQEPYLAHPRRDTGSRQMLLPIAGAMMRSSAINRSNRTGTSTARRRSARGRDRCGPR